MHFFLTQSSYEFIADKECTDIMPYFSKYLDTCMTQFCLKMKTTCTCRDKDKSLRSPDL